MEVGRPGRGLLSFVIIFAVLKYLPSKTVHVLF